MLPTGARIDRYIVEGKLGEGGMATVYRVRHETLGTPSALKVLTIAAKDVRHRLMHEGLVQSQLQHENIVRVTDVLPDVQGQPGLLMEFVEGPSLEYWLTRYQPTLEEALTLFRGICAGVGYAHHKGLIHRDLKPANVLLALSDDRLTPKVADFGLAKELDRGAVPGATRTGAAMGTPGYMAPEQIRDASSVDRRADLWSLGCILYRLTCGVPPFEGDDIIELFNQVASGDFVPSRALKPGLPEQVHVAIERLLEVDRARRLSDCATLIDWLDGKLDALPSPAGAPPPKAGFPSTDFPRWLPIESEAAQVARAVVDETLSHLPKLSRPQPAWTQTPMMPDRAHDTIAPTEGSEGATADPVPSARRRASPVAIVLGLIGAGLLALFLVGLGMVGAWLIVTTGAPRTAVAPPVIAPPPPAPAPTAPARVEEDPPRPAPAPPSPKAAPPPRATPVPPPPAEPAPASGAASVRFSGAKDLWLLAFDGGAEVRELGAVPPGRYRIQAVFEAHPTPVGAGEVTLRPGQRAMLRCVEQMAQCRAD